MANKLRKIFALCLILALCISMMTAVVFAEDGAGAGDADGGEITPPSNKQTHLNMNGSNKQDFSKEDINVNINGTDYTFSNSGNNSWVNNGGVGELGVGDQGIDVTITYGQGEQQQTFDATLVNGSQGNKQDALTGTDVYDITNVRPREPKETQPKETQPKETQPKETQPKETQPKETQPKETQPKETQPKETQPKETQPKETQPKETQPKETQPKETQPKETQPKETQPKETQPKETQPPVKETQPPVKETQPPVKETQPPVKENKPPVKATQPPRPITPAPQPRTGMNVVNETAGEIEIVDEEVPLAAAPKTGDISTLWGILSGFSAAGMALLGRKRKDEE